MPPRLAITGGIAVATTGDSFAARKPAAITPPSTSPRLAHDREELPERCHPPPPAGAVGRVFTPEVEPGERPGHVQGPGTTELASMTAPQCSRGARGAERGPGRTGPAQCLMSK